MTVEDADDFEIFYTTEHVSLVLFLHKQGASWEDAWDFTQHAFLEAYRRWDKISNPRAWLRTTASHAYWRQKHREIEDVMRAVRAGCLPRPYWSNLNLADEQKKVYEAIASLPPRQREVMAWAYDGYAPTEIAECIDLSPAAVRSNLHQARTKLKRLLALSPDSDNPEWKRGTA